VIKEEVVVITNSIASASILLVEDDKADQKLIKAALEAGVGSINLNIANNAEEALDFLCSIHTSNSDTSHADLILLDLNMPGMGGKEFLKTIKTKENLKQIPVIVLTTSNSERDIEDSYKLQAAGYVHKPASLDDLKQVMQDIQDYWFLLCKLPYREN
jgi:two-component system response regulator